MHAALGEPVRLAMAEALLLSDASPGELSAKLGLTTNLMAHHLRVLEEAGLVRRARSEGDGRRSYVQLRADVPEVLALFAGQLRGLPLHDGRDRVVFVCTHNSARSQLAALAWRTASSVPARSAGTHPAAHVHPRALRTAKRHGLALERAHTARLEDVLQPGDLLVAVCDNAYEELSATNGRRPALHWAVPDPVRTDTDPAFEAAYTQIRRRVDQLAAALRASQQL